MSWESRFKKVISTPARRLRTNGGSSAHLGLIRRSSGAPRRCLALAMAALLATTGFVFLAPLPAAAAARGCVTPGSDGPGAALTGVVNSYYPATASAPAGATTISVGPRIPGVSPAIAPGDLLLVIQMQDADISSTNAVTYGDGASGRGSTDLRATGLYEYVSAASAVVGGVVTITGSGAGKGVVNSYDFSTTVTTTHGFRTFQVIRVPQYSSATLGAGLTAIAWDGAAHAGGVLALDVAGALNLNGQTISVDQLGFKGGLGVQQNGPGGSATGTDYVASGIGSQAFKAEGVAGTPHLLYDAITGSAVTAVANGYPVGDAARGAPGTAGGGGTDSRPAQNDENTGGGGGSNGGQGGQGGNSWFAAQPVGGLGGAVFPALPSRVVLGGGGGAGTRNNSFVFASSGGTGGGVVMIRGGSLTGVATISANGGVGVTPQNDGGGGGGAGGSVIVSTVTGTVNGLTIRANGGNGTDAWPAGPAGAGAYHGPGGGGAGGVIITSNAVPALQASAAGGAHGTTTPDKAAFGSTDGAAGIITTLNPGAIPGSSSGAECLPALTVTKSTSTPTVTNTVAGTTATYSITVSNAANAASAIGLSISDALPAGFSYASTGGVILSGGATRPATVDPLAGDTTPTFGTFSIPGSGSVVITFTVTVAASVARGTYDNPATANYLNPTRTTVGGMTAAGYAGGGAERVTVQAPAMTIVKSHVDPFVRGSINSTYALTATNSGTAPSSGAVSVTDTLPAGLTPTAASGVGWTCAGPAGQNVTCTRADALGAGAAYPPIAVTVTVLQSAPNSVTNQASVSGGGQTNTASDVTNVVSQADVSVAKTVSNPAPNQNASVTFTVTTANNGPSDSTGVVVTDLLPPGLKFVSATPGGSTTYDSTSGVWNIGTLANGANVTLSIVATVTGTTPITNTATKTAQNETDPVAGNNSASASIAGQSADIGVTKTVSNAAPRLGENVAYTLVANNLGPSTAVGVQLVDVLPAGLQFVSATGSQGSFNPATGIWNIGSIANGGTASLQLIANVKSRGTIVNTVTAAVGGTFDPNLSNNAASATIVAGLPGLPDTSGLDAGAGATRPGPPSGIPGGWLALLTLLAAVAGLGALALAGLGHLRKDRARLALSAFAVLVSLVLGSVLIGQVRTIPVATSASVPTPALGNPPGGTELIGTKIVSEAPPQAPPSRTFHPATAPITPALLRIPTIGVDAPVGGVGLRGDGSMDVPDNLWTSAWLSSDARPGQAGNAVIAGHRGIATPGLFGHLEDVRPGDKIYVSDAGGSEFVYEVTRIAPLDLSAATQIAVFGPSPAPQLVLVTCYGRYLDTARTYDQRLVVFSRLVSAH